MSVFQKRREKVILLLVPATLANVILLLLQAQMTHRLALLTKEVILRPREDKKEQWTTMTPLLVCSIS